MLVMIMQVWQVTYWHGDVTSFIDTSYSFNALLSGSIYGGLPANRITAIASES